MKVGLFVPAANPFATAEFLNTVGPAAEERGFHSIWVAEHVVLFDEYESKYPYAADGKIPAGGESGMLDPFAALAFLAANTSTIQPATRFISASFIPRVVSAGVPIRTPDGSSGLRGS